MVTDNPFEKVLDRLREKGWCKMKLGDANGPNCLVGGALKEEVLTQEWLSTIRTQIRNNWPEYPEKDIAPVLFNNRPSTTFSDVERVLEKAAVKWEEERVLRDD